MKRQNAEGSPQHAASARQLGDAALDTGGPVHKMLHGVRSVPAQPPPSPTNTPLSLWVRIGIPLWNNDMLGCTKGPQTSGGTKQTLIRGSVGAATGGAALSKTGTAKLETAQGAELRSRTPAVRKAGENWGWSALRSLSDGM